MGLFVLVGFGSRGLVLVGFFLSFFGLFFYFQLCVFSCILLVYEGAPDAVNKVSLLIIKKKKKRGVGFGRGGGNGLNFAFLQ